MADTMAAPAPLCGPPGPSGWSLLDSLFEVRRDRISFVEKAAARFGDFVAFRMGPKRLFLLCGPDFFRHILVEHPERYVKGPGLDEARPFLGKGLLTGEGCEWRNDRAKFEGAMHTRNLDRYAAIIDELTFEFLGRLSKHARRGAVEVHSEMARLTLRIVGRALLGSDFEGAIADEMAADLHILNEWAMQQMMGLTQLPIWMRPSASAALLRLRRRADEILTRITRRESTSGACAALSQLLSSGEVKRARDHIITFLLAGHETTALTLSWAIALLARRPEAVERIRRETENQDIGRRSWTGAQTALDFTRRVIEETLRLYPPVWLMPRKSIENDWIGGYEIPAGSGVLLCIYLLQRHPAYWKQPLEFRPERFSVHEAAEKPAGCYLPFGLGARACIGSRFGLTEAVLILSGLASRFRWEAAWSGELHPIGSLSLHPAGGVPVCFHEA
jgi:cytochrome P450